MLRSIDWLLVTDVSEQPVGSIFKGSAVQGEFLTACPLKVKVKCTLVQALRLCTGRTAHRGSRGIALLLGKGKVHPCTGTEALYRLYGP